MKIVEVLKNTKYDDSIFTDAEMSAVEQAILSKKEKGKDTAYIRCVIRDKEVKLTPEETVRQLYAHRLLDYYGYPVGRLQAEYPVHFGREVKRADIVILDKDRLDAPYIVVELKKNKTI